MSPAELKELLLYTPFPNDLWKAIAEATYVLMDEDFENMMDNYWDECRDNDPNFNPEDTDDAEE